MVETKGQRILGIRKPILIENLWFYFFIAPWLLGFLIFTAGPMIASIVISFMRWELLLPPEFVGFSNWSSSGTSSPCPGRQGLTSPSAPAPTIPTPW